MQSPSIHLPRIRRRFPRVIVASVAAALLGLTGLLLPGVAKDPDHPSRYIVRQAGRYSRDVFQAFGYRRVRTREGRLTLERQPDPSTD